MIATFVKSVKAHGSLNSDDLGEIYQLIQYKDNIVSLGLDNGLKIWNKDLQLISTHTIHGYYQISLAYFQDRFYIGDGSGNVCVYNEQIKLLETFNICDDFISDIKIFHGNLLIVAFDGTVALINLENKTKKQINIDGQLHFAQSIGESYYITGSKSYRISHDFSQVEEIANYHKLLAFKGEIYGINDSGAFSMFNKNTNPIDQCAYDSLISVGEQIIAIGEDKISSFYIPTKGYISWKTQYIPQFKEGYQKRAILAIQNELFVGSDDGKIFKLLLNDQ